MIALPPKPPRCRRRTRRLQWRARAPGVVRRARGFHAACRACNPHPSAHGTRVRTTRTHKHTCTRTTQTPNGGQQFCLPADTPCEGTGHAVLQRTPAAPFAHAKIKLTAMIVSCRYGMGCAFKGPAAPGVGGECVRRHAEHVRVRFDRGGGGPHARPTRAARGGADPLCGTWRETPPLQGGRRGCPAASCQLGMSSPVGGGCRTCGGRRSPPVWAAALQQV